MHLPLKKSQSLRNGFGREFIIEIRTGLLRREKGTRLIAGALGSNTQFNGLFFFLIFFFDENPEIMVRKISN